MPSETGTPDAPQSGAGLPKSARPGARRSGASAAPALVLVAHGSRRSATLVEMHRLRDRIRAHRPGLDVRLAHLGLNAPLIEDVLAGLTGEAVLVPLLLSRGYHVKVDLPAALAAAPGVDGVIAEPLGPHPLLAEILHTRLIEAGWDDPAAVRERDFTAVVLAAAGSRDPEAAAGTRAQARLLADRLGVPVFTGYVAAASPTVAEAVRQATALGYRKVAVAGCFTAPGDFARLAAAAGDWLTSAPLGAHAALAELALIRYDEAVARVRPAVPELHLPVAAR